MISREKKIKHFGIEVNASFQGKDFCLRIHTREELHLIESFCFDGSRVEEAEHKRQGQV